MRPRRTFAGRLYAVSIVVTVLALSAVTWFASRSMGRFYLQQAAEDLEVRAQLVERMIVPYLSPLDREAVDRLCKSAGGQSATRITVVLPSGEVVGDTRDTPRHMDNHAGRPEIADAAQGGVGRAVRFSDTLLQRMMYVAVPVADPADGRLLAVVRTAMSVAAVDRALNRLRLQIAAAGLLAALAAGAAGWLVLRQYGRRLEEMRAGAARFAAGDLGHRLAPPPSRELAELADALNRMAAELQRRLDTIERQRNELEAVLTSMQEGVVAIDRRERVVSMNPAAARWFGCSAARAQGRGILEIIRNPRFQAFIGRALARQEPLAEDIAVFIGTERLLHVRSTPLRDARHSPVGTLVVFDDVTRLRRLESVRRDFAAAVSHEIRTPLTAIKGFVETLHEGELADAAETRRFLGIIRRHVERLHAITEDLLALARIEQQQETHALSRAPAGIAAVCRAAVQACRPRAEAKKIEIRLEADPSLNAACDATLVEQAVVNLLDNAIAYSEPGKPVRVAAGAEGREVCIRVCDQGPGIAQEHLPRLFERFYRVDRARSRESGGTGLGLAIVKHIAEAHGGRVAVESTLGRGSTFRIYLPQR